MSPFLTPPSLSPLPLAVPSPVFCRPFILCPWPGPLSPHSSHAPWTRMAGLLPGTGDHLCAGAPRCSFLMVSLLDISLRMRQSLGQLTCSTLNPSYPHFPPNLLFLTKLITFSPTCSFSPNTPHHSQQHHRLCRRLRQKLQHHPAPCPFTPWPCCVSLHVTC